MEVCVDNVQSFINAVEAGASRIELCSSLAEGGLTPSVGFFRQVKKIGNVQLFTFFMTIMAFYNCRKNRESLFTLKFECKIPFSLTKRKKKLLKFQILKLSTSVSNFLHLLYQKLVCVNYTKYVWLGAASMSLRHQMLWGEGYTKYESDLCILIFRPTFK